MNAIPAMIRLLPPRIRATVYYNLLRRFRSRYADLYVNAELEYAPKVKMVLSHSDEAHSAIAFTGFYELELTKAIVERARAGGLLVDVGANYGYYSLLWASQRSSNKSLAFEASPRNLSALEENVCRNGLQDRIRVRQEAVGQYHGEMSFAVGPAHQTGWGGLMGDAEIHTGETVRVQVVPLDHFAGEIGRISVLKIDIEGADTWAIYGASGLIRERRIQSIFYEEHRERMPLLGVRPGEAARFLRAHGYKVSPIGRQDGIAAEFWAERSN